jgi:hypothetical protein
LASMTTLRLPGDHLVHGLTPGLILE